MIAPRYLLDTALCLQVVRERPPGLLPILPLPPGAGIAYREVRRRAATLSDHDAWLLAHVRAAGLTLITHDGRRLPPVPGVRVSCWARR